MSATGPLGLDFNAVIALAALGGPMSLGGAALFGLVLPEADAIVMKAFRKGGDE